MKPECRAFETAELAFVIDLCAAEGYESYSSDPQRTRRILTAPGVSAVVAETGGEPVGFAYVQSDGEVQAHLSLVLVAREKRGQGIGRELVTSAFTAAGGTRLDLISTESANRFYESFPHRRHAGFRLYPDKA